MNHMKSYTIPIHIRFFDIDLNNHVNNAVYFTYMETARTELFMDDFVEYHNQGITFVVAEASCKYRRPIRLHDTVTCELQLELTGLLHFTITYLFKDAVTDVVYAEGTTKMVMLDEQTNRPIKIPEEFLQKHE